MGTKATSLTGYRVNPETFDGIKTTQLLAQATFRALLLIYVSYLTAPESGFLHYRRAE
jgi:hypothetical protein